jgi:hypothetical protein
LLKKYRNLYVFGDSYSTPGYCVDPIDSFWMMTAKKLCIDTVYNYSWPGNSLDSVVHLLVSDSEEYDWENDFFLIGIPPLVRLTVVADTDTESHHRRVFDNSGNEIEQQLILSHHGLKNISFYDDPTAIRFEDPTWTEIQACRLIYLINSWLDSHCANYVLVNLSKNFMFDSPASGEFLLRKCSEHQNNILFEKTYYDINYGINKPVDYDNFGWDGHQGPVGNLHFFDNSLFPKIKKLRLC